MGPVGPEGPSMQKCVKPGEDQRSAVLLRGAFQVALEIKNPPTCQCRRQKRLGFDPWVRKIPWRRAWEPTSAFLSRESHGQRSLVGYSPQGGKELDTTEVN